jgi:putative addiction module CopG family antidote
MIVQSFPPELEQFVVEQVAAGNYQSEQDLVVSAVRVLRNVQAKQRQLSEDVRLGMQQLEQGEYTEYDEAGLRQLFQELEHVAANRAESGSGDGK